MIQNIKTRQNFSQENKLPANRELVVQLTGLYAVAILHLARKNCQNWTLPRLN